MRDVATHIIVLNEQELCPNCGVAGLSGEAVPVEIRGIEATARNDGWTTDGVAFCEQCGAAVRTIARHVPTELQDLPCAHCRKVVEYRLTVQRIVTADSGRFDFTATLTCPGCARRSMFRKLIESVRRVKHVKVGATGVELDLRDE